MAVLQLGVVVSSVRRGRVGLPVSEWFEAVAHLAQWVDATTGTFKGNESLEKNALTMLDELARWSEALKVLRVS